MTYKPRCAKTNNIADVTDACDYIFVKLILFIKLTKISSHKNSHVYGTHTDTHTKVSQKITWLLPSHAQKYCILDCNLPLSTPRRNFTIH